ncbi:MAG: ABC transporter permease [Planctomycetes bacterium]|nr:ABC transporter permease [Planctomycetota bacterium]
MPEPGAAPADLLPRGAAPLAPPPRAVRLWAVVRRHALVFSSTLVANSLPAFLEPLLFLTAVGIGLGAHVGHGFAGLPLAAWMGPGALAITAMFTASFETTYGTYVRLVYQRTYQAVLSTPLTVADAFLGEVLWCGLKGLCFTSGVLLVFLGFGLAQGWAGAVRPTAALVPLVGLVCGALFGALGLRVTAAIQNLNNFNFYITGVLSPLALFSGMVFPVADLPPGLRELAYALPLFHVTELNRLLVFGPGPCVPFVWVCAPYLLVATTLATWWAIRAMERRIVR